MERDHTKFLINWLNSKTRKPLVIRGARQVGKTWLIRNLAQLTQKYLIELNFEKQPDLETLFTSNDPKKIITNIAAFLEKNIELSHVILFLDEIQVVPQLLAKLRWFAEEMSELAVIAAGSLLDFALADHEFSMPVGRISYMYLEPLSLEEFFAASGYHNLREYLQSYHIKEEIPTAIHKLLMELTKEYLLIGGMPAAVFSWINEKNLETINQVHLDLLTTYREDFAKYRGRLAPDRLEEVFASIPHQLGQKFTYSRVNQMVSTAALKQGLDLLVKARVCHQVYASSANGLPLNAELKEKFFKVILLDCGLANVTLGLSLHQLNSISELNLINSGGVAEQLVGQQLRTLFPPYAAASLNYWLRTEKGASAEIDYVIQHKNKVVPIEVKAGSTGALKSLHLYMNLKRGNLAVRINSDYPTLTAVDVSISEHSKVSYTLLSIPFYLIGQLHRLIDSINVQ